MIGRVDIRIDRERSPDHLFPSWLKGEVVDPWVETLRSGEYSLDHLSAWYCATQESQFLTGVQIFEYVNSRTANSFASLNDGHALQGLGLKFIEKFGRDKEYVLWGTVVRANSDIWVPIIYGAQRTDEVFILWDNLKNDSFGKNRPALRFTAPGN